MTQPTAEQTAAADAFRTGDHLAIQAGAGTGKTTTLAMLARCTPPRGRPPCRQGRYIAFNKALSYSALRTVTQFCQSADAELTAQHVPRLRGVEADATHAQLSEIVLPFARKAWGDLQHPERGTVRFEHDHYLKMWALSEPKIAADFLLLDEAQDTNPVVEQVFTAQRGHAQLVLVGDSAQAIYGWRGARDVMSTFDGRQLTLSRSFRFGPALAEEANRWLAIVDAPIRLIGSPSLPTELAKTARPDAVLCRTNVGAMVEVIRQLEQGRRVALAGGGGTLAALAQSAHDLRSGRRPSHPELMLFESWEELREYAEYDPSGRISSRWSSWSTNTARRPCCKPWTDWFRRTRPRSRSRRPTARRGGSGRRSGSRTTSPLRTTSTNRTRTENPSPGPSISRRRAWRTWLSHGPELCSTSAA